MGEVAGTAALAVEMEALLRALVHDAIIRQLSPSQPGAGRPLSSLVSDATLHRVPAAALIGSLNQQRWAVLDGALSSELVAGAGTEAQRLMATEGLMARDAALGPLRLPYVAAMSQATMKGLVCPATIAPSCHRTI